MNKEWSELNKTMQAQIKKKDTYKMGIDTLFNLRRQLMQTLVSFKEDLCREDFNAIPFITLMVTIARRLPIQFGIFFVLKILLRIQ